mgnify:CR=1 FL=1
MNLRGKFTTDAPYLGLNLAAGQLDIDGGVRRGTDVLKAVALGAKMVFAGRPFAYAAAVGGQEAAGSSRPGTFATGMMTTSSSSGLP